MATPEDIEHRLTAVERDLAEVRQLSQLAATDASAARTLAAGADHDVSEVRAELRAHTSALNALRQTQIETVHTLDRLEGRFDRLEGRFDGLAGRFDGLEGRFDGLEGRFGGLEGRFDGLERTTQEGFATMAAGMDQIVRLLEAR